jgi:hypothetical protein
MVKQAKTGKKRKKRKAKKASEKVGSAKKDNPVILADENLDDQTKILCEIHAELRKLSDLIEIMAAGQEESEGVS